MAVVVVVGLLAVASVAAGYYALMILAPARRTPRLPARPRHRFIILIPAHNEAQTLPVLLRSLMRLNYPPTLREIVVVADNCTDATAEVAREFGTHVIERTNNSQRGKGYALAHALEELHPKLLAHPEAGVIVLDADCEADANLLNVFDAHWSAGARVLQVGIRTRNPDAGTAGFASAVGMEIENRVARGRDWFGLTNTLRGYGMGFRAGVLLQNPWRAFSATEDAEYAATLHAAGIVIRHDARPLIFSEAVPRPADLYQQRRRWRGALFTGGGFLHTWMQSKPIVLGQLMLAGLAAIPLLPMRWPLMWWLGLIVLTAGVYLWAIRQIGLNRKRFSLLCAAPWTVARLAFISLRGLVAPESQWLRTTRAAELVRPH